MSVLDILLAAYRAEFPQTRIQGPIRLAKNTSATKQQECVLCGEQGPTCSAKWKPTVKYYAWAESHCCWANLSEDAARVRADEWLEASPEDAGALLGWRWRERRNVLKEVVP